MSPFIAIVDGTVYHIMNVFKLVLNVEYSHNAVLDHLCVMEICCWSQH